MMKHSIILLVISICLLTSCSGNSNDLETWIQQINMQPAKDIKALPEVSTYKSFTYTAHDQRSPFDNSIQRKKLSYTDNSLLQPNTHRTPQLLEKYPLDSLSMMGTISKKQSTWALIQTPDKKVHRISTGQYLGQNFGKVVKIETTKIHLTELIPSGLNTWKHRKTSIAIKRPDKLQSTL